VSAPVDNEHANVEPASELNPNVGVLSADTTPGAWSMAVTGPVVSMLKTCSAGVPVLPAASTARTLNV
jgi:hypothetical protein